ncbi:hypothetical protein ACW9HJ_14625 [Nocardia gipuzkoensis]
MSPAWADRLRDGGVPRLDHRTVAQIRRRVGAGPQFDVLLTYRGHAAHLGGEVGGNVVGAVDLATASRTVSCHNR